MQSLNTIAQRLKPYALKLCGYNEHDAQDLIQDTLLKMLSLKYLPKGELTALVRWTMRNTFIDSTRKKQGIKRSQYCPPSFTAPNVEHAIDLKVAHKTILQLNPIAKRVMQLYAIGYGQTEIAAIMNEKNNCIGPRIHYSQKRIQQALAQ